MNAMLFEMNLHCLYSVDSFKVVYAVQCDLWLTFLDQLNFLFPHLPSFLCAGSGVGRVCSGLGVC